MSTDRCKHDLVAAHCATCRGIDPDFPAETVGESSKVNPRVQTPGPNTI